jgi:hypothetical protein
LILLECKLNLTILRLEPPWSSWRTECIRTIDAREKSPETE